MNIRWLRKRIVRSAPFGVLVGVSVIALLPILLPIALVQHAVLTRRMRQLVEGFVCLSCGTRLGAKALRLGDERWRAIVSDLQARHPGAMLRLVRDVHAVCPGCGGEYTYRESDNSLTPRLPREPA